jgi:hypothetical protein
LRTINEWYRPASNGLGTEAKRALLRRRPFDRSAVEVSDRLMPQADAENRDALTFGRGDRRDRPTRPLRAAGARRDHDRCGAPSDDGFRVEAVVARHLDVGVEAAQRLDEIPGEGVVVVDDEDHES